MMTTRSTTHRTAPRRLGTRGVSVLACLVLGFPAGASPEVPGESVSLAGKIRPLLAEYCFDCHGDGMSRGQVAFDAFGSDEELLGQRDLWLAVLRNVRAGLMPPAHKRQPSREEKDTLANWIKHSVFDIDPRNPDPGRVTLRRLNRTEYRNTIRDLMGFDFKVEEELPPDDTGYGFDNIGDVLALSPLLLEKYMQAAEAIVGSAVPRVPWVVAQARIPGSRFRGEGNRSADRLSFYDAAETAYVFHAPVAGTYRLTLELQVLGQFDFDPGICRVTFADDEPLLEREFGWRNGTRFAFEFVRSWEAGDHPLTLALSPLTPVSERRNSLDLRMISTRVEGPLERDHWVRPEGFERFFTEDPPEPSDPPELHRARAADVLRRFATRAYRRPVDDLTVERLASIAEATYRLPDKRFEDGIAQAMVPILASPRFLFRVEPSEPATDAPADPAAHPYVDEFALASRLSYFLWSTMPDDALFELAARGELRRQFRPQIERMLKDPRSEALIDNFVGQWLQARDVEGIDINARVVLARDSGEERDMERRRARIRELLGIPEDRRTDEQREELRELFQRGRRGNNQPNIELDGELRRALRRESELSFAHVVREDRSVLELLDADYTFLNERLARHYGLSGLGVEGSEMRKVSLPKDSPRGGILTQGTTLIVTSNPTRTSPVKRGLFILENILGTPPPPPPADVPDLEEAEKEFSDRQPTLRETLEIHRANPLCNSCHNRMDPLGLALENFNALGMWRESERRQPIDAAGRLITGQTFNDVRELKRTLVQDHARDFYHCLTEKLLTYALGRGLQAHDVESVDRIVHALEAEGGRFSALLMGIVESAPFQKRRALPDPGPGRDGGARTAFRATEPSVAPASLAQHPERIATGTHLAP